MCGIVLCFNKCQIQICLGDFRQGGALDLSAPLRTPLFIYSIHWCLALRRCVFKHFVIFH